MLNKFLGASVLMSGVESMLPGGSHKEVVVSSKPSSHQVSGSSFYCCVFGREGGGQERIHLSGLNLT